LLLLSAHEKGGYARDDEGGTQNEQPYGLPEGNAAESKVEGGKHESVRVHSIQSPDK
jgi:hypothetical protein